jgi:replicative DNA helicase
MQQQEEQIRDSFKTPPNSVEAEQCVIGGLILDNAAWDLVSDVVKASDFYRRDHRIIFEAISDIKYESTNEPVDVITLSDVLKQRHKLEEAGGMVYLGTLAKDTPSAANIVAYAKIVRDKALLRDLIQRSEDIIASAYDQQGSVSRIVSGAQETLFSIMENKTSKEPVLMKSVLPFVMNDIDERFLNQDKVIGLSTGFDLLDDAIIGLEPQDFIIIAARPSMGKSTMMMNIAEHAAIHQKKSVVIFSMEMSEDQITKRTLSNLGNVNFWAIRNGKLADGDWPRLTSAVSTISDVKLFIDDSPALTVQQIRSRTRRLQRLYGVDLVMIDYIQLMRTESFQGRTDSIGEISRGIKGIAKEMDIPVVALSQLNRSLESRPDKRPVMSDLRDSGSLEQDSDLIMFIYRDVVYNEDTSDPHKTEIIIAKNRNGPIRKILLKDELYRCRFTNYSPV